MSWAGTEVFAPLLYLQAAHMFWLFQLYAQGNKWPTCLPVLPYPENEQVFWLAETHLIPSMLKMAHSSLPKSDHKDQSDGPNMCLNLDSNISTCPARPKYVRWWTSWSPPSFHSRSQQQSAVWNFVQKTNNDKKTANKLGKPVAVDGSFFIS